MKLNPGQLYNEACLDVVIATIFSLSRSIKDLPFPNENMTEELAEKVIKMVDDNFDKLEDASNYKKINIDTLDILTKKILEEANVIPNKFNETLKKQIIINEDNSVAILLNFNDHITIRSRSFGFFIKEICTKIFMLEEYFESKIPIFSDEKLGYITTNIFYFGTSLMQSVLLSIPGIVMMNKLGDVVEDLRRVGIHANGYYSAPSPSSMGHVYYLYNEASIVGSEEEQIFRFSNNILKIIYLEREQRCRLYLKSKVKTNDMIARALAIAKAAKLLDIEEAINLAFKIKLGLNLSIISNTNDQECNAIFYKVQVAHIAYALLSSGFKNLSDELIKMERASVLNKFSQKIKLV